MINKLTKFNWIEEPTKQFFNIHVLTYMLEKKKNQFNKNVWNIFKKNENLNWIVQKFTIIC